MKNTIKTNRQNEIKAAEEARKAAARKAELDAIEPKDIVGTMDEVAEGSAHSYRDTNGNAVGTYGGDYTHQDRVNGKIIAAKSQEELDAIKERMSRGIEGDGLLHQIVVIEGHQCECVGATEEELAKDIEKAENYVKAHGKNIIRDIDIAEQLADAGYAKENLEQVEVKGKTEIIAYDEKRIMDLQGNTVANVEDIEDELSRKSVKTILVERAEKR